MPDKHSHTDDIIKGAALVAAAVFMIASGNALAKFLSGSYHPVEITFYRNVVVLIGLMAWMRFSGQWQLTKTADVKGQIYRSVVGTCGVVTSYWAISKLPLADATTLLYTAPLFVTLLSFPLLGEKVGLFRGTAVIVGFAGIVIVAGPSGQNLPMDGVALALAAALFHGLTQLQLRKLGRSEHPMTTVFYFMLFGTILTGIAMPFVFTAPPAFDDYPFVLLVAFCGIAQQVLKTIGYSIAPAAVVTPVNYSGLVWAALIGFIMWDEVPPSTVYIGAAIIISSNLFILWREQRLKKYGGPDGASS